MFQVPQKNKRHWASILILGMVLLAVGGDVYHLSIAERAASPYRYDLFEWETRNLADKWLHRLAAMLPWHDLTQSEERRYVQQYFQLGEDMGKALQGLAQASALNGEDARSQVRNYESTLVDIRGQRSTIQADVEERIESLVSQVVSNLGLSSWGGLILPPVDIRLTEPPKLLVTSPRSYISRKHEVLIEPTISMTEREQLEHEIREKGNLSALVVDIGGLATYPASIPNNQPLRWTLQAAAHEWLHHYFFFQPLGQHMFDTGDMMSLNETIANVAGRELGDMVYQRMGGIIPPEPVDDGESSSEASQTQEPAFDFRKEMQETRRQVEELLAENRIEEAEAYMEARRQLFVQHGYYIRKLNQAYFAFHGTYADTPASISPIGGQVQRFRELHTDLGSFLRAASSISSYAQFEKMLSDLEDRAATP